MTEKSLNESDLDQPDSEAYADIRENIRSIKENIGNAAKKRGRNAGDILLLAATKTVNAARVNYALRNGITDIGENRVQELLEKYNDLETDFHHIHFIGSLQTNKVKDVVGKVCLIHSVDSERLALAIAKESIKKEIVSNILIEVNIGRESSKSGVLPEETQEIIGKISKIKGISVKGLMAIPPICEHKTQIDKFFSGMEQLFIDIKGKNSDNVSMDFLSMGMSGDYGSAIEHGANIVRIGTGIFGTRK